MLKFTLLQLTTLAFALLGTGHEAAARPGKLRPVESVGLSFL